MADMSLDQYISKGQGNRLSRGGISQRLGPEARGGRSRGTFSHGRGGPGRGAGRRNVGRGQQLKTKFNVVGLGNLQGFDARQKLSNQPKKPISDARQRIMEKTKFVDARNRIEIKKAAGQALDVRNKIETNKAKKVDARERIKARQNIQNQNHGGARQQVVVTGLGQSMNVTQSFQGAGHVVRQPFLGNQGPKVVSSAGGTLRKTIKNSTTAIMPITGPRTHPQVDMSSRPLMRTVSNDMAIGVTPLYTNPVMKSIVKIQAPGKAAGPIRTRVTNRHPSAPSDNGLLITTKNKQAVQSSPEPYLSGVGGGLRGIQSSSAGQWSGTESSMRSAPSTYHTGTTIRLKNDMYIEDLDFEEDIEPEPVRQQMIRTAKPQMIRLTKPKFEPVEPFQPSTVRAAIQRASAQQSTQRAAAIPTDDVISPLQGFQVLVTNLHPIVTGDDIVELFGAVGALKKARLMKPGIAEVVFVKKEEALMAIKKYHLRELDGQPMQLVLASSAGPPTSPVKSSPIRVPSPVPQVQEATPVRGPLRLGKPTAAALLMETQTKKQIDTGLVDSGLIHRALFKSSVKEESSTRPVTFTVKI